MTVNLLFSMLHLLSGSLASSCGCYEEDVRDNANMTIACILKELIFCHLNYKSILSH